MKNVPEATQPSADVKFSAVKGRHLRLGRRGEKIACRFLRQKGFDVLVKNFKCRAGEIDIVARDGAVLCFIEVKTRRWRPDKHRAVSPLSHWQSKRVKRAALDYLEELEHPKVLWRFDLIEIGMARFGVKDLFHWKGNFGKAEERRR